MENYEIAVTKSERPDSSKVKVTNHVVKNSKGLLVNQNIQDLNASNCAINNSAVDSKDQEDELSSEELNPKIHRKTLVKTLLEGQHEMEENFSIELTSSIKEIAHKYTDNVFDAASKRFAEVERRLSAPKIDNNQKPK